MKLSIVVNNYNYAKFLREAIDGALRQTWGQTEVVVVDDGSTDDSRAIIESYGKRVKPVFKENGGQNSALNSGLDAASGDVVIFLDADDRIFADTAERVMHEFAADSTTARVQWPLKVVDAEGNFKGSLNPNPEAMVSGDLSSHILRYRTHVWPAQSGNAYSASILRQLFPIPSDFHLGCDLYLAETTALMGPVRSLYAPGGDYRIHGKNGWSNPGLDVGNLRRRIEMTTVDHDHVRRVAALRGLDAPESVTEALDVAFIFQRLSSLRLEPELHPLAEDRRLPLMARGIKAAVAHPHHTSLHKAKRVGWLLGVGLAPRPLAAKLIERFYFR